MDDDIPLNAMYTRVDISTSFTTSVGLNPNDMASSLRRAQAQLCLENDFPCNVALAHAQRRALSHEHQALSSRKREYRSCHLSPDRIPGFLQGYPKGRPLSYAGLSILARRSVWWARHALTRKSIGPGCTLTCQSLSKGGRVFVLKHVAVRQNMAVLGKAASNDAMRSSKVTTWGSERPLSNPTTEPRI